MPQTIVSRTALCSNVRLWLAGLLMSMTGSSNATPLRQDARTPDWLLADAQEFVPTGRRLESSVVSTSSIGVLETLANPSQGSDDVSTTHSFETYQSPPQPNPYLDPTLNGATFYQNPATFQQPVYYTALGTCS
jgi:hypothetical protein